MLGPVLTSSKCQYMLILFPSNLFLCQPPPLPTPALAWENNSTKELSGSNLRWAILSHCAKGLSYVQGMIKGKMWFLSSEFTIWWLRPKCQTSVTDAMIDEGRLAQNTGSQKDSWRRCLPPLLGVGCKTAEPPRRVGWWWRKKEFLLAKPAPGFFSVMQNQRDIKCMDLKLEDNTVRSQVGLEGRSCHLSGQCQMGERILKTLGGALNVLLLHAPLPQPPMFPWETE